MGEQEEWARGGVLPRDGAGRIRRRQGGKAPCPGRKPPVGSARAPPEPAPRPQGQCMRVREALG